MGVEALAQLAAFGRLLFLTHRSLFFSSSCQSLKKRKNDEEKEDELRRGGVSYRRTFKNSYFLS